MTLRPSSPNAFPSAANVYPSGPDTTNPGTVARPLLAGAQVKSNPSIPVTSTVDLDSDPFTPAEGELLVVKAGTNGSAVQIATVAGGGLPWKLRSEVTPANGRAHAQLWTAAIGRGQSVPTTVSVTVFNDSRSKVAGASFALERWTNATLAATPNTATVPGSVTPLGHITSGTVGAAITWADIDYNADISSPPSYHAGGQQTAATINGGTLVAYYAYNTVVAAGTQTFGMDDPDHQQASLVALELLPALVPTTTTPLASLWDDFSSTTLDITTRWPNTTNPAGATAPAIVGGRARVYCQRDSGGNPLYSSIQSALSYTLSGSSASVRVPTVPTAGGATGAVQTALILTSATAVAGRRLVFAHRADLGVLQFRHEYDPAATASAAYYDPTPLQVTYLPVDHLWWRIRHTGTQVIWETSPDNFSWSAQRTVTAPAWCSANDVRITLESWRTGGVNDYAEFDDVNGPIVPPPPAPAVPPLVVSPPGPVVPQVPVPVTRLLVADTMTGVIGWELPWSTISWSSKLNDVGTQSATLVVEAVLEAIYSQGARNPGNALRETLDGPNRFSYVVAYGNVPVWAGPMQPSVDVPADTPTVNVGGKGIESLIDKRVIMGYTSAATGKWADASRDVVFSETNPASVIYQLVQRAIASYAAAPFRSLPITCSQPPSADGDESFTFLSYDLKPTWSAISDLTKRDDGPDVRFVPQLANTNDGLRLTWDLQIGDPFFSGSGPLGPAGPVPWVFDDASAAVARQTDAVGTASTYFVAGSGQDRDKVIARATSSRLTGIGFPAMEQVDTGSNSETDPDKLQAQACGAIAAHETPTETWAVTAAVDGQPPLGAVLAGDPITADVRNHWLILPGAYTRRVTEVAGDGSPRYTLTCAPNDEEAT